MILEFKEFYKIIFNFNKMVYNYYNKKAGEINVHNRNFWSKQQRRRKKVEF